jgi:hypothetical protein
MSKTPENQLLLPIINEQKATLCKCGCGQRTTRSKRYKRFNIFINHHHKRSPEFKESQSKAPLCACGCKLPTKWNTQYKRFNIFKPGHYGKTEKNRKMASKRMSLRNIEQWQYPEYREKQSKQKSEQNIEYWQNPENREKRSKQTIEFFGNPENRKKLSERMAKYWQNPEYREKQAEIMVNLWLNPEYRERALKAGSLSPNKPETILNQLTPSDVRYTGNRSFWVRIKLLVNGEYITKHKNPDFKITGQKKVIELYGNYWHKSDNPDDLINAYKAIGYDCLVIWESEIYNELESTIERIAQFMDKPQWQMTLL